MQVHVCNVCYGAKHYQLNVKRWVIDVSDVRAPQEVGYFIPPQPTKRYGPVPVDRLVAQSEDVLVDSRGYAYLTHKNQGLWILKFKDNSSAK